MATGYFSHPDCLAHEMGQGHPECPQRIHAIEDQLRAQGLDALLQREDVPLASNSDLALAHDLNYVLTLDDFLQQLEANGDMRALDPDTWACPGTRSAAWRAAGAAVAATDAVLDGRIDNAFCAVPIVHHAGDSGHAFGPGASHWWVNETSEPVVLISADVVPEDKIHY